MKLNKIQTLALFTVMFLFLSISCRQRTEEKRFIEQEIDIEVEYAEFEKVKSIYYDIYSPVKAHRLFRQIELLFDFSILNPVENLYRYNSSNKIAINLGIFGADMSFCHMFGQTQETINYLSAIQRLAEKIGISGDILFQAENARTRAVNHPDTLFNIATNIYISADKQLKESDRAGAASLILAGGWIEALYIVSRLYDAENPDRNLEEQIITQKYSLDRLIAHLSNHQDDEYIAKYLLMIRQLKHFFDKMDILFDQEDLMIDTTSKTIEADRPRFKYAESDIDEIINLVEIIRQDMIN